MTQDQKNRLGGVFMLLCGATLAYGSIWRPYQGALRHEPTIVLHRGGIAMAILFPLLGIILIVFGEAANNHIKQHTGPKKTPRGWAYILVIGAIALLTYYVVESKFEALGYTL